MNVVVPKAADSMKVSVFDKIAATTNDFAPHMLRPAHSKDAFIGKCQHHIDVHLDLIDFSTESIKHFDQRAFWSLRRAR